MFDSMENDFKSPVSTISPRGQSVGNKQVSPVSAGGIAQTKRSFRTPNVGTVTQFPAQKALPLPLAALTPDFQSFFWGQVNRSEGCWEWGGNRESGGYGRMRIGTGRAHYRAHRISYFLAYGIDPADLHVCHRCDNPLCCNPAHLFLGTDADNLADMRSKGRGRNGPVAGAQNPNAKMNEADARQVIALLIAGKMNTEIAAVLPVGHSMVSKIRSGKAWQPLAALMGYVPKPSKWAPKSGRSKSGLIK